jgi:hypothetical protein
MRTRDLVEDQWREDLGKTMRRNYKNIDRLLKEDKLSLREISLKTGAPFSTVAWRRRTLGIKKQHLQRWTKVQVRWLKTLYPFVGDHEIALIFSEAYHKEKGWTLKHIEKKRLYLGLKRTREQIRAIRERNKAFGCFMVGIRRMWETREVTRPGEVHKWNNGMNYEYLVIKKEDGSFEKLARYTWKKHFGEIPKGLAVVKKDQSGSEGDVNNLELINRSVLAQRNRLAIYPTELRDTIITLNTLNKKINEKQDARP